MIIYASAYILYIALFIDNYDFMTTSVQYLRLNNVSLCNSTYDTFIVCPSFSTPAVFVRHFPVLHFPPPAMLSVIFQSSIFQPCTFVRHSLVLQIPALHFCPSFSSPAFSCPANSVAPSCELRKIIARKRMTHTVGGANLRHGL